MARVHPHIFGLMPKRQARIIESNPELLWATTMVLAQSQFEQTRWISAWPNITSVGWWSILIAIEISSVSG